jgi:hypothetical protein
VNDGQWQNTIEKQATAYLIFLLRDCLHLFGGDLALACRLQLLLIRFNCLRNNLFFFYNKKTTTSVNKSMQEESKQQISNVVVFAAPSCSAQHETHDGRCRQHTIAKQRRRLGRHQQPELGLRHAPHNHISHLCNTTP